MWQKGNKYVFGDLLSFSEHDLWFFFFGGEVNVPNCFFSSLTVILKKKKK